MPFDRLVERSRPPARRASARVGRWPGQGRDCRHRGWTCSRWRPPLRRQAVRPYRASAHDLEVAGTGAAGARGVRSTPLGTVGASPAATAAWLGARARRGPGRRGGAVSGGRPSRTAAPYRAYMPVTISSARGRWSASAPPGYRVEACRRRWWRAWSTGSGRSVHRVAAAFPRRRHDVVGDPHRPPPHRAARARPPRRAGGAAALRDGHPFRDVGRGAHGLDHDERSRAGLPDRRGRRPHDGQLAARGDPPGRPLAVASSTTTAPGPTSGTPRRSTRPLLRPACCAGGQSGPSRAAVARSVAWLLDLQRRDGSWGIWGATAEETAYALHLLVPCCPPGFRPGWSASTC